MCSQYKPQNPQPCDCKPQPCPCEQQPQKPLDNCKIGGPDLKTSVFLRNDIDLLGYNGDILPFQIKLGTLKNEIILNEGSRLDKKTQRNNNNNNNNGTLLPWDSKRSAYKILEPGIYEFNAQVTLANRFSQIDFNSSLIQSTKIILEEVDSDSGCVIKALKRTSAWGGQPFNGSRVLSSNLLSAILKTGDGPNQIKVGNYIQLSLQLSYVATTRFRNLFSVAGLDLGCNNTQCKNDATCCPKDDECQSDAQPAPSTTFYARRIQSLEC